MGFFGKKNKEAPADMVSLVKKAKVSLDKHGIGDMRAAVYLVLDHSFSMKSYYRSGDVQKLTERILGLSSNLDDDGTVPVVLFADYAEEFVEVDVDNYRGVASRLANNAEWGSTNYVAAIDAVMGHYANSGAKDPALIVFQTDGNPNDPDATTTSLRATSDQNVFFAFVSFGDHVSYLDELDNPQNPADDNVSHFNASRPSRVTDEELYDGITSEFSAWINR